MDIITIDIETYYDSDYSLSKMTTEEYIRDDRFECIMVGVKVNDGATNIHTGTKQDIHSALRNYRLSKNAVLCHNTAFDGAYLSWHQKVSPRVWFDTLSMARNKHTVTTGCSLHALTGHYGIGAKGTEVVNAMGKRRSDFTRQEFEAYASYCRNDVELTYKLFKLLRKGFPVREIQNIDLLIRAFVDPRLELDTDMLVQHLDDVRNNKDTMLVDVLRSLGSRNTDVEHAKSVLMSNDKFAMLLSALGVTVPTKTSLTTGKETYAFAKTDKGLTDLLEHEDVRVQAVVACRLGTKSTLEETRTERFIGISQRGPLPVMLNYWGAHTGRYSGGEKLNLQNLPSRGGKNTLKRSIRAADGYVVLASDSSQIEARLVACIAGQQDLVEAFAEGRDVYSEFASMIYERHITKADKDERFVGKVAILSLGYGAGAARFREMLRIQGGVVVSLEEAEHIVKLYRDTYHRIVSFWRTANAALRAMIRGESGALPLGVTFTPEGFRLPNGMFIYYHGLRATEDGMSYISDRREYLKMLRGDEYKSVKIYGGKATENICQALAAQIIREQMVAAAEAGMHVVLQVHDEIVCVVPEAEAGEYQRKLESIMSTPPTWAAGVPLACEAGYAKTYGDT